MHEAAGARDYTLSLMGTLRMVVCELHMDLATTEEGEFCLKTLFRGFGLALLELSG